MAPSLSTRVLVRCVAGVVQDDFDHDEHSTASSRSSVRAARRVKIRALTLRLNSLLHCDERMSLEQNLADAIRYLNDSTMELPASWARRKATLQFLADNA